MKRFILVIGICLAITFIVSACENQHKCPAYGHYTEVAQPVNDNALAQE